MITISEILKGSEYSLTQFSQEKIFQLEERIEEKEVKGKSTPYITCLVRNKSIKLTPEEIVRQLYLMVLTEDFHYPASRMELEYAVTFGREKKRADIVVFDKDQTNTPYIIVELKSPTNPKALSSIAICTISLASDALLAESVSYISCPISSSQCASSNPPQS